MSTKRTRKDGIPRKTRSDAKLLELAEKDRKVIAGWLAEDGVPLCLQRIASVYRIQCGQTTLYEALAFWRSEQRNDQVRAMAVAQIERESAEKEFTPQEKLMAIDRARAEIHAAAEDWDGYEAARYQLLAAETAKTKAELEKAKLQLKERGLAQKDEEIIVLKAKFKRETCELFLKWSADAKAKKILNSTGTNAAKIEALGKQMFGEDWDE